MIATYPITFSSGNGDSSDWSSAAVTFNTMDTKGYSVMLCYGLDDENSSFVSFVQIFTSVTFNIPLYKGNYYLSFNRVSNYDGTVDPIISGNCIMDNDGFVISGDCSITIKGKMQIG